MKELRWEAAVNRLPQNISRIIPGDWGKAESGWLAHPLLNRTARSGSGGRIHQFLWRRSRAVSTREKGTARRGAMRNRFESSQVAWKSFESRRIAVTQRVSGCYCAPARANDSGGLKIRDQPKERRRKAGQSERSHWEGHAVSAGPVKTFRNVGDSKNATAGL